MSPVANAVLGGWNVSTITLIQSGPFLTPTIGRNFDQSNTNMLGRRVNVRPDRIGSGTVSNPTPDHYFDMPRPIAEPPAPPASQ